MTTHELRRIREGMQQSPRFMADELGVNIHTYYLWERGREIPQYFAMAIKFLASQGLPKDPTFRLRPLLPREEEEEDQRDPAGPC